MVNLVVFSTIDTSSFFLIFAILHGWLLDRIRVFVFLSKYMTLATHATTKLPPTPAPSPGGECLLPLYWALKTLTLHEVEWHNIYNSETKK